MRTLGLDPAITSSRLEASPEGPSGPGRVAWAFESLMVLLALATLVGGWEIHPLGLAQLPTLVFLACFTQALALMPVRLSWGPMAVVTPALVAAGLYAPGAGAALLAGLATYDGRRPGRDLRWSTFVTNRAAGALGHGIASLVAISVVGSPLWQTPTRTVVYGLVLVALNSLATGVGTALVGKTSVWAAWRRWADRAIIAVQLLISLAGGMLYLLLKTPAGYLMSLSLIGFIYVVRRSLHDNERMTRLWQAAHHDPLTGLLNRRGLEEQQAVLAGGRPRPRVTVIAMDLDHFKVVNDTFGHDQGDVLLAAVGAAIRQALRPTDLAARLGGEEFLMILPGMSAVDGSSVAERLRQAVALIDGLPDGRRITASCGVASCRRGLPEELFREADRALYQAKREGRDRVTLGSSEVVAELIPRSPQSPS